MKHHFEYIKSSEDKVFDDLYCKHLLSLGLAYVSRNFSEYFSESDYCKQLIEHINSDTHIEDHLIEYYGENSALTEILSNQNSPLLSDRESLLNEPDEAIYQLGRYIKKNLSHIGLKNVSLLMYRQGTLVNANIPPAYIWRRTKGSDYSYHYKNIHIGDCNIVLHFAILNNKKWEANQTLRVFFMTDDEPLINVVLTTAREWSKHCSISFERAEKFHRSDIRIQFNERDGHWSWIGTDARDKRTNMATMNLNPTLHDINSDEFKRIILHEFGHALGLIHEHQNPNVLMKWDKETVYKKLGTKYGWNRAKVDFNVFQRYENETKTASPKDPDSIMTYFIEEDYTIDRVAFARNYTLSNMDIEYIGKLYPPVPQITTI